MSDPFPTVTSDARHRVVAAFAEQFGGPPPLLVRAPGRVNIMGDHTDYNEGWVLPMAIEQAVWIAARPRADRRVILHSLDLHDSLDETLGSIAKGAASWREYAKGVLALLDAQGPTLAGWEGCAASDLPMGAGLGASGAFAVAIARVACEVAGRPWEPVAVAESCRRSENEWVGVYCGIMDPLISATADTGHAMLIDCRSLAAKPARWPANFTAVVLDTGVRRALPASTYNERVADCMAVAKSFGVASLRDVTVSSFAQRARMLSHLLAQRARHVITENERVLQAARALERGDGDGLGILLNMSQTSLRNDFEVSGPELNGVAQAARSLGGCSGARMIGAGFGGCVLAVVANWALPSFTAQIEAAASRLINRPIRYFIARASSGVSLETISNRG